MKEVYVFGAGASHASGRTPLGPNLIWDYYMSCSTMYKIINGKPDSTEHKKEFINLEKFLELFEQVYPERKGEKNSYLKALDEGMDYQPPSFHYGNKKYYFDEMVRILKDKGNQEGIELIRQLTLEHIGGISIDSDNSLYRRFVSGLKTKVPEQISIISFNFDCLLCDDFKNEIYFDYLIKFDADLSHRAYDKHDRIALIKPNGSLDWAICSKCNRITLLLPLIAQQSYNNRYCKIDNTCHANLKPLIYLPYEGKSELMNILWNKAKMCLSQADIVTIIGYSFPEYDKEVMEIFQQCLSSRIALNIVDVDKDVCERIKDLFPVVKNIKISLDGFQGYLRSI